MDWAGGGEAVEKAAPAAPFPRMRFPGRMMRLGAHLFPGTVQHEAAYAETCAHGPMPSPSRYLKAA